MLGFDFQKIAKNDRFERDFTDLGLLGSGGFAEVHRVEHKNDGRLYAVKIIKVKPSRNEQEAAQQFYRALSEVKLHSQLDHPHILKYYGCWMELISFTPEELQSLPEEEPTDSQFEMVLQQNSYDSDGFVFGAASSQTPSSNVQKTAEGRPQKPTIGDGKKLNDYKQIKIYMLLEPCQMNLQTFLYQRSLQNVEESQIHWKSNLEMAMEMVKGLTYLHSKKIIHRDIKLHNFLLDEKGHCKLIDFGLARKTRYWKSNIETKSNLLTVEEDEMEEFSKSVGTRLFSSPEQATSENYNHRTDIFSLAMVIVLLFCSFTTVHHQRDLIEAIRTRNLEDIHMPPRLKNMMHRCLGSEEERASVPEIQGLLKELLREQKIAELTPLCERKENLEVLVVSRGVQVLVGGSKDH